MNKGQSISINTIIIAAIAILVLVVVIVVFIRGMNPVIPAIENCATYKGTCEKSCGESSTLYTGGDTNCKEKGLVCCIPIPN